MNMNWIQVTLALSNICYSCAFSKELIRGTRSSLTKDSTQYCFEYLSTVVGNGSKHVILIPPLGVGISRWYYDRLLTELKSEDLTIVAPDLLCSGSASAPEVTRNSTVLASKKIPLFTSSDWSAQISEIMASFGNIDSWCIVSNGGCVPVALEAACICLENKIPVTNIVLSSPPSLSGLMKPVDEAKREKSYQRLSGVLGNLFWWYARRRDGRFIQKFSEKNLAVGAETLGENWRATCFNTCSNYPNSRFSTFSFLAGGLRGDCSRFFSYLKGRVPIHIISGVDKRRNTARSWFWERPKTSRSRQPVAKPRSNSEELSNFLKSNSNRGEVNYVNGRICLAHEDAKGYASCLVKVLSERTYD